MIVGLVEVEVQSPVVIVAKKGKGRFYETTKHIPSSTILGGLAREIIIENNSEGFGNCANLKGPNEAPPCETCSVREKCNYTYVWAEKKLKLSYCLPHTQKALSEPPPIPSLASLFKARGEDIYTDGLILITLQKLALKKEAKEKILMSKIKVNDTECKKETASVCIQNNTIRELSVELNNSPHVAINPTLKTSEKGYLFNYTTMSKGTKLTATVIGDEQIIEETVNNKTVSIGMGKSRGNGQVRLRVTDKKEIENYKEMRAKAIKKGLEDLQKGSSELLETEMGGFLLGTITGLSPLPISEGASPTEAVARRINVPPEQIIHLSYKQGTHTRFEFCGVNSGPTFILTPTLNLGYAGVFKVEGDLDGLSDALAQVEVNLNGYQPWFGWLTINHPIHLLNVKDQLRGE